MQKKYVDFVKEFFGPNSVVIACGLPATYKTETIEVASEILGIKILRSDLIRLEVLKNEDIFDEKVASNMNKRTAVYDKMFEMADDHVKRGEGVFLDATFITQQLRIKAAEIASKYKMTFIIQHTSCPKEVSLKRISRRTKEEYVSNALTEEAYTNNEKKFEAVDLNEINKFFPALKILYLVIDTVSDNTEDWTVTSVLSK